MKKFLVVAATFILSLNGAFGGDIAEAGTKKKSKTKSSFCQSDKEFKKSCFYMPAKNKLINTAVDFTVVGGENGNHSFKQKFAYNLILEQMSTKEKAKRIREYKGDIKIQIAIAFADARAKSSIKGEFGAGDALRCTKTINQKKLGCWHLKVK